MKRLAILFCLFIWDLPASVAQDRCISVEQSKVEALRDTGYARGLQHMDDLLSAFESANPDTAQRTGFKDVIIPVVVHVLYRLEENNITYDQILSQMEVLNRDFNWENEDKVKIPEVFRQLGAGSKFHFRLADKDPDGNFTNGVTRTQTTVENIGTEEIYHLEHRGGVAPWNQAHYMNVWVCELEGNTLGFALMPGSKMSARDGIVMSPRAFGTMGTAKAPYNKGRTFVHEVGHYFGLRHLWGSDNESCKSTDYISDTPKQKSENYGCKTFPSISCGGEPNGDMFMNYMDYSNDTCALLFTKRQVELMQLVLKTNRRAMFNSGGYTGLESLNRERNPWVAYPVPSDGELSIEFFEEPEAVIHLYTVLGSPVRTWRTSGRTMQVDVMGLASGIYLLRTSGYQQKIIIR